MGEVIRLQLRPGKTGSPLQIRQPPCSSVRLTAPPSARPEIGQVRITIDGVEHHVPAEDALLLAAEIVASAADAYRREGESKRG